MKKCCDWQFDKNSKIYKYSNIKQCHKCAEYSVQKNVFCYQHFLEFQVLSEGIK